MLLIFKNLAKFLEDKKLQIKHQDKVMANYTKRFIKKKVKLSLHQSKDFQDLELGLMTKCKFNEKKYVSNKYWYLQVEYQYYYKIDYITKFCKKKLSPQIIFK